MILEQLHMPDSRVHRHVIVAISGFLSEKSDSGNDWLALKKYCEENQYPLYALRWESKDSTQLAQIMQNSAEQFGLDKVVDDFTTSWTSIFSQDKLQQFAKFAAGTFSGYYDIFKSAQTNAKMSGKAFAHYLASDANIIGDRTLTLVGFSLGT